MNRVILMGRLTRDPEIRYSAGEPSMAIARYSLAVDRARKADGEQQADFISCVAFGKNAEFAEKYLNKGTKIVIEGRIVTGNYTDNNGNKVYTTDVVIDHCEFAESKKAAGNRAAADEALLNNSGYGQNQQQGSGQSDDEGFMNIPDGIDEELPFG